MIYPHGVATTRRSAGQMDSHQRKSSPAESSCPAPPPTLVRAQQHEPEEMENLRALPRSDLQALAKRFKIKANAKTDTIIDQLVNCEAYALLTPSTCSPRTCAETEREQCHLPKPRRHSTTKSDKPDDISDDANVKIKNRGANLPAVTHTATTNADVNAAAADASTEPSPSAPKETENKLCNLPSRCSATALPMTARMNDRVA